MPHCPPLPSSLLNQSGRFRQNSAILLMHVVWCAITKIPRMFEKKLLCSAFHSVFQKSTWEKSGSIVTMATNLMTFLIPDMPILVLTMYNH